MAFYHYRSQSQNPLVQIMDDVPASAVYPAVVAAQFLSIPPPVTTHSSIVEFDDLPSSIIHQLRSDGMRGTLRSLDGAREVFDHNVPDSAKTSIAAVEAITNDPNIHWMHIQPHAAGGSADAFNGVYGPAHLNHTIGSRPMTADEIQASIDYTDQVARSVAPQSHNPSHVHTVNVQSNPFDLLPFSAILSGGMAVAHRCAQVEGMRSAGRHDLAQEATQQLGIDAVKGACNGLIRGSSLAITQAALGSNPFTAGIGLVVPDALRLMSRQSELTKNQYQMQALGVIAKGAVATTLVCAGPIGWLGLTGLSLAMAYGSGASISRSQNPPLLASAT